MPGMARSTPDPALASVLRDLRAERGLSLEVVAVHAGISAGALSRIEREEAAAGFGTVRALADVLGVTLVELARRIESA